MLGPSCMELERWIVAALTPFSPETFHRSRFAESPTRDQQHGQQRLISAAVPADPSPSPWNVQPTIRPQRPFPEDSVFFYGNPSAFTVAEPNQRESLVNPL
jgi:hypothetical protein